MLISTQHGIKLDATEVVVIIDSDAHHGPRVGELLAASNGHNLRLRVPVTRVRG